jgi:hypothetical protein
MREHNGQFPVVCTTAILPAITIAQISGERGQVALRYSGATWQFNLWDNVGWQTCPDQASWVPPILVRGVVMHRVVSEVTYTDAVIEYNSYSYGVGTVSERDFGYNGTVYPMYQSKISNLLTTRNRWVISPSRIWLAGSTSTFTEIYLSA